MIKVKNIKIKPLQLLIGFIIITLAGIGITNSLILMNTNQQVNTFTPGNIACEVQEDCSIKNTGNTSAWMRAEVIVNWKDESGNVYATIPEYTINLGTDWEQSQEDGYYYYTKQVKETESTTAIISNIETTDIAPDGYTLSITILSEAIQANDENKAIENAWGVVR